MRFIRFLCFLVLSCLFSSFDCRSRDVYYSQTLIGLFFQNNKGEDVLNPTTPGHFDKDSITFSRVEFKACNCACHIATNFNCGARLMDNTTWENDPYSYRGNLILVDLPEPDRATYNVYTISFDKNLPADTVKLCYSGTTLTKAFYNQRTISIPSGTSPGVVSFLVTK